MATLLRIDSSPFGSSASFSRQLTAEFVQQWQRTHPDGKVITRDVAATKLPPISAEWIDAADTAESNRSSRQREILAISNQLIVEVKAADEYVAGVAMHNFSIPSVLKLWIDEIVRVGETFAWVNNTPVGLLKNKKATFLVASGGVYDQGTPRADLNFIQPYLRSLFAMLGVTKTNFITAGGTARFRDGVSRDIILQAALASIDSQFEPA